MKKYFIVFLFIFIPSIVFSKITLYKILKGHLSTTTDICFYPDSKKIATSSFDKTIKIWDIYKGREIYTLKYGDIIEDIEISNDGKFLISAGRDKKIKIFDALTYKLLKTLSDSKNVIFTISISPDSKFLAAGTYKKIYIYELKNFKLVNVLRVNSWVRKVKYSPDNKFFAAGCGKIVKIWEIKKNFLSRILKKDILRYEKKEEFNYGSFVYSLDFSSDSQYIAIGGEGKEVQVYRVEDGLLMWNKLIHDDKIWDIKILKNFVISASEDTTIKFSNILTGKSSFILGGNNLPVYAVSYSKNLKFLGDITQGLNVYLWKLNIKQNYKAKLKQIIKLAIFGLIFLFFILLLQTIFSKNKSVKDWEL